MSLIAKRIGASLLAVAVQHAAPVAPVFAQASATKYYDLPAQSLDASLRAAGRTSGREVMFLSDAVRGRVAPPLRGDFTPEQAIRRLLTGRLLDATFYDNMVMIRGRDAPSSTIAAGSAAEEPLIVVTGSRLRGAPIASPTLRLSRQTIADAGQTDLGQAVRALPLAFAGGQNPGVGVATAGAQNENLNAASTINLRGLGPDATLTLLNGHRLPYDGARQGIDVSTIPLAALDRLEIVADGASAIYGSDAVGGVANIILKRDFDGLVTSARFATATDGGDTQQDYSTTGGTTWSGGGFLLAYRYEHASGITAGQRRLTRELFPTQTLLRPQSQHSAILVAHQSLTPMIEVTLDALYGHRTSRNVLPFTTSADYRVRGRNGFGRTENFAITPGLKIALGADWSAGVQGMYGSSRTRYGSDIFIAGNVLARTRGCYCNQAESLEVNAEGAILALPGGTSRLAIGAGYRRNHLRGVRTAGSAQNINAAQRSYFAYGEVSFPLVGPDQQIPWLRKAFATAALRYEDYPGIDRLATPKLGLILSPTDGLDLKLSWGRSFKTPTLFQLYSPQYAVFDYAYYFGGNPLNRTATVLQQTGGNAALRSERATTWSGSVVALPQRLPGARFELSYVSIRYGSRIVQPILYSSVALSSPIYAQLITRAPSAAVQAQVLATAELLNYTSGGYDPASVTAIVNNLYLNAARQDIEALDAQASYTHALGGGTLTLSGLASYLHSDQRLSTGQPTLPLAGTLYNPPTWRARGGVSWTSGSSALTSYINYIGGVRDERSPVVDQVGALTTLDLAARHRFSGSGFLDGLEISASVQNIADAKPDRIARSVPYAEPYDSTNYSIVGRLVSIAISKQW